jgi:Fe-S-cluster containining protein
MITDEERDALLRGADSVQKIAFQGLSKAVGVTAKIRFVDNLQRGVDQIHDRIHDQIQDKIQPAANAALSVSTLSVSTLSVSTLSVSTLSVSTLSISNKAQSFACQAGCSHCCEVRVEALVPEILQIVSALKQLPADILQTWRMRLQTHVEQVKHLSTAEHRVPCVFLQDHLCTIYAIRPAVCRKAHSYNVSACADHHAEIPQSLQVILQAEALIKGTAAAYAAHHLDASGHELSQAVLAALDDEDIEAHWQQGAQIFV